MGQSRMLFAIVLIAGCGSKGLALSPIKDAAPGIGGVTDAAAVADRAAADESQAVGPTQLDGASGGSQRADGGTTDGPVGNGGASGLGGAVPSDGPGGKAGAGGAFGSGGVLGAGGAASSGGARGSGGVPSSGGAVETGGLPGTGATTRAGGAPGTGGVVDAGGTPGLGGTPATGGAVATGGATDTGGTSVACSVGSPPAGATSYCSLPESGSYGSYQWFGWENGSGGCFITYANADAAFSATWDNSGDFMARVGLQWDGTKTYDQLGTITARFAETKTGTDGGYSYIGIYGLSVSPCVEFYIVDDSFTAMPIKPYSGIKKGTAVIDGETYAFYGFPMTGTGPASCPGRSPWTQIWSVRQTARQCGQVSVTDHFKEWRKLGTIVGNLIEVSLVVETLGGSGRVDFTTGSMTVE